MEEDVVLAIHVESLLIVCFYPLPKKDLLHIEDDENNDSTDGLGFF